MDTVTARIGTEHYQTTLSNGRTTLTADEPESAGGTDLGFSPSELLCSALATCTCVTLRMYADRKEWPLQNVNATVTFERDAPNNTSYMNRRITLEGPLSDEQRQRLLAIANQCFIHRTLTGQINIATELT
ncbi:MAG: OsmC family protein [Bacteroidia bacterium]|jgi:putative redox protein|nr:OsmC family protein [Bacteroidia bacterium]